MNNQDVWKSYEFYTSELTKHARYLGFAGIAVCWFFRTPDVQFPAVILAALVALVAFFLTDLLQYYVSAMRLRRWMHAEEEKKEKESGSLEGDYWPPKALDQPAFVLFRVKLGILVLGFAFIALELVGRMAKW